MVAANLCALGRILLIFYPLSDDRLVVQGPVNTVVAKTPIEVHLALLVIHPEDPGETTVEGHGGAVEDTVSRRDQIPENNRVAAVVPDDLSAARMLLHFHLFPGSKAPGTSPVSSALPGWTFMTPSITASVPIKQDSTLLFPYAHATMLSLRSGRLHSSSPQVP